MQCRLVSISSKVDVAQVGGPKKDLWTDTEHVSEKVDTQWMGDGGVKLCLPFISALANAAPYQRNKFALPTVHGIIYLCFIGINHS